MRHGTDGKEIRFEICIGRLSSALMFAQIRLYPNGDNKYTYRNVFLATGAAPGSLGELLLLWRTEVERLPINVSAAAYRTYACRTVLAPEVMAWLLVRWRERKTAMGIVDIRQQRDIQYLNAGLDCNGGSPWDLWLKYWSLGGDADEHEVEAHLGGKMFLPGLQRKLLRMAMEELSEAQAAGQGAGIDPFGVGLMLSMGVGPYLPYG